MVGSKKKTLVKVNEIKKVTGWNRRDLEKARELGWVTMVRDNGKIYYILESLNENFIKQVV